MGCWATYDLLMKNPTLFAGVICSSGATGASQAELSKLLGIPLRVYYGEKDAESMVTQIKATQQRYVCVPSNDTSDVSLARVFTGRSPSCCKSGW